MVVALYQAQLQHQLCTCRTLQIQEAFLAGEQGSKFLLPKLSLVLAEAAQHCVTHVQVAGKQPHSIVREQGYVTIKKVVEDVREACVGAQLCR